MVLANSENNGAVEKYFLKLNIVINTKDNIVFLTNYVLRFYK